MAFLAIINLLLDKVDDIDNEDVDAITETIIMENQKLTESLEQEMWFAYANGVVPRQITKDWLFGRDEEMEALEHVLNQIEKHQICGFKLLEGDYGTGKSAMIAAFESHCINRGFVVARLSLAQHNNMSKPEILYRDIMSHLKTNHSEDVSDFEEIFDIWLKQIKQNKKFASKEIYKMIQQLQQYHPSFATVLLVYIRGKINHDIELSDIAAAWIKGDYNLPYEQKKKLNIKGSVDRHNAFDILKGFSKLLNLLGYKGLVICIDELEWIMNERSDIRIKAYTTLRQLVDEIGQNRWTNTFFLGAHTPEIMENVDKGFKSYRALYQRINSEFNDRGQIKDYRNLTTIPLKALTDKDYMDLGERIGALQLLQVSSKTLANLTLVECKRMQMKDNRLITPRVFIKTYIHFIELAKNNPNMSIFKVRTNKII